MDLMNCLMKYIGVQENQFNMTSIFKNWFWITYFLCFQLADEMGLGKTLQTISLFCQVSEVNKNAGPFLVIAPLSTLLNWKREVERFAPGVPVKLLYPKKDAIEEWDYLEDRHPSPLGGGRTLGTIYITR